MSDVGPGFGAWDLRPQREFSWRSSDERDVSWELTSIKWRAIVTGKRIKNDYNANEWQDKLIRFGL